MNYVKSCLIITMLLGVGWGENLPVSLYIENVDLEMGTLDIFMTNEPACSYCEEPQYNNNYADCINRYF